MQYHKNGFRPGDPSIADPVAALPPTEPWRPLPEKVDVLVVGSGPTGLTLTAQLARIGGVSVALAEAKPGPLTLGQADGIACRSLEMFHAFGFAHKVMNEAYWVNETVFWKPDPAAPERVARSHRIQDVEDGLSEMPHVILNQARIHDFFLEVMRNADEPVHPRYGRRFVDLQRPENDDDPIIARFETEDGSVETVAATYVVGCDGARSQVRRSIGIEWHGDAANQAWGVMDVLGVTDLPDVRFKVILHAAEGNMVIIPREGGYLVRYYIEMDELDAGERARERGTTLDDIVDTANRILHPYTLEPREVPWWSVYEIGQRLADRFDDGDGRAPRVFIAGDACHTHSPKAGQGMNVSMRDGYNLGWKLAATLRGLAAPSVLATYNTERHAVAKELIEFDRELATMMSARPADDASGNSSGDGQIDPADFQRYFQQHGRFMAGVATTYQPSLLVSAAAHEAGHQHRRRGGDGSVDHAADQAVAKGFQVGTRFHSAAVARIADGKVVELGQVAEADGRWRLYLFGDEQAPASAESELARLCRFLEHDERSPLVRYTPAGDDIDAVFDVRGIVQPSYHTVTVHDVPGLLRPRTGLLGLVDYQKVFCPTLAGPDIFDLRAVDRSDGAIIIVRPDQHVASVLPLTAHDRLATFFDRFMISPDRPTPA